MNFEQLIDMLSDPSKFDTMADELAEKMTPPAVGPGEQPLELPRNPEVIIDNSVPKAEPMGALGNLALGLGGGQDQPFQAPPMAGVQLGASAGTRLNPEPILRQRPENPLAAMALGELFKRGIG